MAQVHAVRLGSPRRADPVVLQRRVWHAVHPQPHAGPPRQPRNCQHRDPNLVMKSGTSPADLHRNLDAARQGATGRWGAYTAASSPPRQHTRQFTAAKSAVSCRHVGGRYRRGPTRRSHPDALDSGSTIGPIARGNTTTGAIAFQLPWRGVHWKSALTHRMTGEGGTCPEPAALGRDPRGGCGPADALLGRSRQEAVRL